jgi:hypothetical protein
MRYVLLVCSDEAEELNADKAEARYAAYLRWEEEMKSRGAFVTRERLKPTSASTTVRAKNGELVIADVPFAETKEQIAGYFVVETHDLDDAIDLALLPAVEHGTVEVRPVWEM